MALWEKLGVTDGVNTYVIDKSRIRRKPILSTEKTLKLIKSRHGDAEAYLVAELCSHKYKENTAIYVRKNNAIRSFRKDALHPQE